MNNLPQKTVGQEVTEAVAKNKSVIVRVAAVAGAIGLLALAAPIVSAAVSAGLGIIAVGAITLVGIGVMQALPLLGQKWENAILKARKAEARANPVEQLENRFIAKKQSFEKFKGAMKIISGQINRLTSMIEGRQKTDPGHDLAPEKRALEKMKQFYQRNLERGKTAESALLDFGKAIERFRFQFEFAQQGNKVFAGLKSAEGGDVQEEMLSEVAIDEIERQFDSVYGELEVEAVFGQAKQIESSVSKSTIDAEFTDIAADAALINNRRK